MFYRLRARLHRCAPNAVNVKSCKVCGFPWKLLDTSRDAQLVARIHLAQRRNEEVVNRKEGMC